MRIEEGRAAVLAGIDAVGGPQRVRDRLWRAAALRIPPLPKFADLRFWAFAGITSNTTPHVTVITPQ